MAVLEQCDEWAFVPPPGHVMPLPEEDLCCQKFQPNIFDPSRCFSCLRTRKQHSNVPPQEDSDGLSVVSSYCDVTRDRLGYEDGSLCILSPDCALYICDEEDSTTSTQDQCDYPDLSGSITSEEDYLHLQDALTDPAMTRLDSPPHRPSPRAWMDEARSRESFGRRAGSKEERERESGYFSLGRASGIKSLREKSPPPTFRHAEVGHPLPSTRSPEPKATIPFRNPDLGVPSQRRSSEPQSPDLPQTSSSPPSPATSRSSSPSRLVKEPQVSTHSLKSNAVTSQSKNRSSSSSISSNRRGLEARSPSPEHKKSSNHNRSPSPQRRRHMSSQSSLSESESSHISAGSGAVGFNKEEYAMMADLPKVKTIFQREVPGRLGRAQSRSPEREERYKPAR
ncbi:hypothetical protein AAFF_G00152410 [Aldrovandia affinis]|uniref:Uncharacterized protein n=1 Tax=Aldrovandia affinis TaxID=143900 RepID=A0AAD7RNV8_9TELE|nr:hypothetical protein AAFF_G00152410 [Aldrovandia affinis]